MYGVVLCCVWCCLCYLCMVFFRVLCMILCCLCYVVHGAVYGVVMQLSKVACGGGGGGGGPMHSSRHNIQYTTP